MLPKYAPPPKFALYGPVQVRGATSRGVHTRALSVHTGAGRCRYVEPRQTSTHTCPGRTHPNEHVDAPVQTCTHTCKGRRDPKGHLYAPAHPSRRVYTRAQGVHTQNCTYTYVQIRPDAYTPVYRAYTPKRARTRTCKHIQTRTHPCTVRTHPNGHIHARAHTCRRVHTCTGCTHPNGHVHAREHTSRRVHTGVQVVHTGVQVVHTQTGTYMHVHTRPDAYTHVHWAYTPKRARTRT